MPEKKAERKFFVLTDFSPHRRGFRVRIAGRQQQLCLMCLQYLRRLGSARPPLKSSLRQAFLRQPEPLSVIDENPDGRSTSAAEENQASGKGICLEFLAA